MAAALLALQKLKGESHVKVAARHNLREIQAELGAGGHIDARRSHLNVVLHGPASAADVAALADELMAQAGISRLRKDAVRAIEIVVSLPVQVAVEHAAFFRSTLDWVLRFFSVPVLSAVVHRDEAAPHIHLILLPLIDGRMQGSDLIGNKRRLEAMQCNFYESVASAYGLSRPRAGSMGRNAKREGANAVVACLESDSAYLHNQRVKAALVDAIARNPGPLMEALDIALPQCRTYKGRSFVEVMTQRVKPEAAP